jgi:hypothetical protein
MEEERETKEKENSGAANKSDCYKRVQITEHSGKGRGTGKQKQGVGQAAPVYSHLPLT